MDLSRHSILPMADIWCSPRCAWPWLSAPLWCWGGWWRWQFLFHLSKLFFSSIFWVIGLMVVLQNFFFFFEWVYKLKYVLVVVVSGYSLFLWSFGWTLKEEYHPHYIVLALFQIVCVNNIISYIDLSGGTKPLLGDILVIAGTIFFAMSNVGEVGESFQFYPSL